jgi:hypothetical protein
LTRRSPITRATTDWPNRPADIHPEQNASLWNTELPVGITHNELLGAIRDTGRVREPGDRAVRTRVISIYGHTDIVNEEFLKAYFS